MEIPASRKEGGRIYKVARDSFLFINGVSQSYSADNDSPGLIALLATILHFRAPSFSID